MTWVRANAPPSNACLDSGLGNGRASPHHPGNTDTLQPPVMYQKEPRAHRSSVCSYNGSEDLILVPNSSQSPLAPLGEASPHTITDHRHRSEHRSQKAIKTNPDALKDPKNPVASITLK